MSSKTQAPVNATTKPSLNSDKSGLLQRQCACGNSAGLTGECTTCQTEKLTLQRKQTAAQDNSEVPPIAHEALSLPRVPMIQAKLTVGASDDPLEREADRVADQVIAAPTHPSVSNAPPRIQRFTGQSTEQADMAAPASVDRVLSSPGRPLEPGLQQDMGQRFGHDFSQVRVHTDAAAERSAQDVDANAYTVGHNIVFGRGQFAPGTNAGRTLIAHELTHVLQQGQAVTRYCQKPNDTSVENQAKPNFSDPVLSQKAGQSTKNRGLSPITAQLATGDAPAAVQGVTGLRVARQVSGKEDPFAGTFSDTPVTASTDKLPALTADELMERLVVAERAFQASPSGAPINTPKGQGSALGPGYKTYAGVQIIDKEGNQVISAIGRYLGGGKAHAEADAIRNLRAALQQLKINIAELRMMVVVDQTVCEGCTGALEMFAQETGITQMDTYLTSRDNVTPKTAARTAAKVGAKAKLSFTKKFPPKPTESTAKGESKAPAEEPPVATVDKPPTATADKPVDTTASGATNKPAAPTETKAPVETEINVVSALEKPGGQTITELEINFGKGLEFANKAAPEAGALPWKMGIRITQNADGVLLAAESTTGQPASLAEAMAEQILHSGPGASAGGAAEGTAVGASRALTLVSKGLKWGGTAVFVVITGYQLITSKPEQRPRVVAQAAGGLAGSIVGTYLVCNLALDIETVGWGILICGFVAGGVGGYAGSEVAGEAYDEATMTDLDRALQELSKQPVNLRRLFYSLVVEAGAAGFPMTPEFVKRFIGVVPGNLKDSELITLAGKLHATSLTSVTKNADAAITSIRLAIDSLPGRGLFAFDPRNALKPDVNFELNPNFSFGTQGAGKVTIFPGFGRTPIAVPSDIVPPTNVLPLLQIDLDSPKKKK